MYFLDLMFRKENEEEKEFLNCIVIDEGDLTYYIQKDGKDVNRVEKREMEKMFENGWKHRKKDRILGSEDKIL